MNEVLYRKYRPSKFEDLIGQDYIKTILTSAIDTNSISHAYLFCGPRGTGKTSMARLFAKAVNCLNFHDKKDVCNECINCQQIINGSNIDIIEMDAASNRGIEEIRIIRENINYLPSVLKYKIYIIDEAHMLTKEAFNALLKTLEEPPNHVIFILATTEPHKIPVTILSRVQRFDFSLASKDQLIAKLNKIVEAEGVKVQESILDLIFERSGGSYRDSESLLGKLLSNSKNEIILEDVKQVLGVVPEESFNQLTENFFNEDFNLAIKNLEDLYSQYPDVGVIIDQYLDYLRNKIFKEISQLEAKKIIKINKIINKFIEVKRNLRDFENRKVLLEISIIQLFDSLITDQNSIQPQIKNQPERSDLIEKQIPIKQIPKNTESSATGKVEHADLLSYMKSDVGDARAAAILETSSIIFQNDELKIKNKYQFNLKYLQKDNVQTNLKNYLQSKNLNNAIIKVELDADDTIHLAVKPVEGIQKESYADHKPSSETSSSKNIQIDNSELVEELLT